MGVCVIVCVCVCGVSDFATFFVVLVLNCGMNGKKERFYVDKTESFSQTKVVCLLSNTEQQADAGTGRWRLSVYARWSW